MLRINGPGHKKNRFALADLSENPPRRATVITPEWCNAVQEELISVILESGKSPSEKLQLQEAISILIERSIKASQVRLETKIGKDVAALDSKIAKNAKSIGDLKSKVSKNTVDIEEINKNIGFLSFEGEGLALTTGKEPGASNPDKPISLKKVYAFFRYKFTVTVLKNHVFLNVSFTPTVKRQYQEVDIGSANTIITDAPNGLGNVQSMAIPHKIESKYLPQKRLRVGLSSSTGAGLDSAFLEISTSSSEFPIQARASESGLTTSGQPRFANNITYNFVARYEK